MVCIGGAAMRLADEDSRTGFGGRILRWACVTAAPARRFDLPVFLKFGGIDAEFLWMRMRVRSGAYRFSIAEFDDFARESVFRYGRFLDALTGVMDRGLLRICAAYPAVLDDAHWADGFFGVHRPADRADLAHELAKTKFPTARRGRNYAGFQRISEILCRQNARCDDFSPFLDPNGDTDDGKTGRIRAATGMSYVASEERMVVISASIPDRSRLPPQSMANSGRTEYQVATGSISQ
jgi:hypothetical protein